MTAHSLKYAGMLKRFFAFFVDSLCILLLYLIIGIFLNIQRLFDLVTSLPLLGLWWFAGMLCVSWIYYATLESSRMQATIGKKIFRLRVVNQRGEKIGFFRASVRYFAKFLSRFSLCLGFLMILFTNKKQALHDKIASTLIIENE